MGKETRPYTLGLDLGSSSIGWAAVELNEDGRPVGILGMGVRLFPAGTEGDLDKGRDESRAVKRRQARLLRRQHARRARRIDFIYLLLQNAGLLPHLEEEHQPRWKDARFWRDRSATARKKRSRLRRQLLDTLDDTLLEQAMAKNIKGVDHKTIPQRLPYVFRTLALDEELSPHALGRALYHLAERRGYASNRKSQKENEDERGAVESGIRSLRTQMEENNWRTLGELLLHKPREERVRCLWTARDMYQDEFEKIWAAQKRFHPDILTDALHDRLYRAIFRQRPLRSVAKFIGECEWEKGRKRAPLALLAAQRFRLVQMVNNLRISGADFEERPLTDDERQTLLDTLEFEGDIPFSKLTKTLGHKKKVTTNFERGGEKRLVGNRTGSKLAAILGIDRWRGMSHEERDAVVEEWRRTVLDTTLEKRGISAWGMTREQAKQFAALTLEDGYLALSRQALAKVLPLMERGLSYAEACAAAYGDRETNDALDALPPAPEMRNPVVERILTELRKVANAVIRRYGKPEYIRIELARELRKGRQARQMAWKKMRDQENRREEAKKSILNECGIANPSRDDIEKVRLYKECNAICPYTGRSISMANLFDGSIEVEHIIPFSICLDNSFLNKTLCDRDANRQKSNRTPWEAFGHDEQRWHEITCRLKKFPGGMFNQKVKRFLSKEPPDLDSFTNQQLTDTSYAAKASQEYMSCLYGAEAKKRIQAARGGVTYFLRSEWNLNRILGDGNYKSRDNHRHHAVDALVIALTDRKAMRLLSEAAVRALTGSRRHFSHMEMPWPDFENDAKKHVMGLVISRRVDRRVSGPLHEETYYGSQKSKDGALRIRKPLHQLKEKDFKDIADKAVREAVESAWSRLPKPDPKLFESPEHMPYLTARDGLRIPIRKVRLAKKNNVITVGEGDRQRRAVSGNNHHAEIIRLPNGKLDWIVVSMFEAYQRVKNKVPVIQRDHGDGGEFLYSLCSGELVEMLDEQGTRRIFVCRGVSDRELKFTDTDDARLQKVIKDSGDMLRIASGGALLKRELRKIAISPLGEVFPAND